MIVFANIVLFPLFLVYQIIILIKNCLYDAKILKSIKLSCAIISVGNITTGGTGKTPAVIAIAKFLQQKNKKVAILSRGYGRKSKGTQLVTDKQTKPTIWELFGDEPMLMAKSLVNIPIVVDKNRVRGGQFLIDNYHPEVIILDDAFQHRKIFRDIDIVLINSNLSKFVNRIHGFNNFREPWSSLKRAHLIFITKANVADLSTKLNTKLEKFRLPLFKTNIVSPSYLLDMDNHKIKIDEINKKSALLFSGIGDHISFDKLVTSLGFKISDSIYFPDHHNYSISDIEKIRDKYNKLSVDIILTTEKDIIKISETDLPIFSVPILTSIDKEGYEKILGLLN